MKHLSNNSFQISLFDTIFKSDIWDLKLDKNKVNRDKYFLSIDTEIDLRLRNIQDSKKAERFKQTFYNFIFDTRTCRGIHFGMTIDEIYKYEYDDMNMGKKGIQLNDIWFYEGAYIHLHGYNGTMELLISKIADNYIEVSHRFDEKYYLKRFGSVEELKSEMWKMDEVKELDKNWDSKSDEEVWDICSLLHKVTFNFDRDNTTSFDYINQLQDRCYSNIRARENKLSDSLDETEYLKLVSKHIYNNSWDVVKESIDKAEKKEAIAKILWNHNNGGGSFCKDRFNIGSISYSRKGVEINTTNERKFSFSWSTIYDNIGDKNESLQLDFNKDLMNSKVA